MASNGMARVDGMVVDKDAPDFDQAYEAYKLRQGGRDWPEIAQSVGYASAKTAEVCVRQYLQSLAITIEQEHRDEILNLEMARINRLISSYWDSALAGEVKHAEFVLKAIQTSIKLLGLDTLHEKTVQSSKTIVITGTAEEYVQALKTIAEDTQ